MADPAPHPTSGAPPLPFGLNIRLSVMMFLQYAIWGAWLPILYPFLMGHRGFSLDQTGWILAAGAAGAIVGPFVAGQFADRHFHTEKFLAVSHLLGAAVVWFLASVDGFWPFLFLSLVYGVIYAPTLALTNSLAFHHLPDRDRDFGKVRVWGTIGWIVVGIGVGHWLGGNYTPEGKDALLEWANTLGLTDLAAALPAAAGEELGQIRAQIQTAAQNSGRAGAFQLSALLGVVMAAYCLLLPKTPPSSSPKESNASLEALGEVKRQPLLTLFLLAVPISMIHQFYFVHTSGFLTALQVRVTEAESFAQSINAVLGVGGGGLMTIGQMTEILVLAAMPFLAKKVSRKSLLAVGIAAYAARMAIFAYADGMVPILIGVGLHGLCFGCFIFVAFMVVDEETTPDVRASAQNLFNLVIVGIGIIVGSWFATSVVGAYATVPDPADPARTITDYTRLFSVPMFMALACLGALLAFYRGGRTSPVAVEGAPS